MKREELPQDVTKAALWIVRGYERRRAAGEISKPLQAVTLALGRVGEDLPEGMRAELMSAIMRNSIDGRKCPFEVLGFSGMSRTEFYRRKRVFLADVARQLEIL